MGKKMENEMETGITKGFIGIRGFSKFGIPFLGAPIIRIIVFWGLYLGSPYFGKLQYM